MLGAFVLLVFFNAVVAATCNSCSEGTCDEISLVQKHVDVHIADEKVGCQNIAGTYTELNWFAPQNVITINQNGCDVTVRFSKWNPPYGHKTVEWAGKVSEGILEVEGENVGGANALGKVESNGDVAFTDKYWGKQNCPETTIEYAVDLCMETFSDRDNAINQFRNFLEDMDGAGDTEWFKHKKGGKTRMVKADYFNQNGFPWLHPWFNVTVRFRKDIDGDQLGKADLAIKYKESEQGFPLQPLTPGSNSPGKERWSCKREDNMKYKGAQAGIVLEAQEQQGRYKKKRDEKDNTPIFNSADDIKSVEDVVARFPAFAKWWGIDTSATLTARRPSQWRYVLDDVELELNTKNKDEDAKTESSFTLWYDSEEDMRKGNNPKRGEWSFKVTEGEDTWKHKDRAGVILKKVGEAFPANCQHGR